MTSVGVTGYLIYENKPILALISMIIFAKIIIFHFIMEFLDKRKYKQTRSKKLDPEII